MNVERSNCLSLIVVLFFFQSNVSYAFHTLDSLNKINHSIGININSVGIGLEGCFHKKKVNRFDIRPGIALFKFSNSQKIELDKGSFIDINPNLEMIQLHSYIDYLPFKNNGFRLTGGIGYTVIQNYEASFSTTTGLKIGGMQIASDDFGNIDFRIRWQNFRPYLGIGFGKPTSKGKIGFGADIGCFYMGKPNLSLQYEGFLETTTIDEGIKKIEYNMRGYRYYPHIAIQLKYKIN